MPEHRKRPRDPAQLAKLIVDIATGEVEEGQSKPRPDSSPKTKAAKARTPARRAEEEKD
jgi:hypothetical protein